MIRMKLVDRPEQKIYKFGIGYFFPEESDLIEANIEWFDCEDDRNFEFACMLDDGEHPTKGEGRNVTLG